MGYIMIMSGENKRFYLIYIGKKELLSMACLHLRVASEMPGARML